MEMPREEGDRAGDTCRQMPALGSTGTDPRSSDSMPQRTAGFLTGATLPTGDTATSGDICGCHGVSWHRVGGSKGCHSALHSARDGRDGGDPGAGDLALGCRKVRPLAMVSVGAFHAQINLKIVSKHVPLRLNLSESPAPDMEPGPGLCILGAHRHRQLSHPEGGRSGGTGRGQGARKAPQGWRVPGTGAVRPPRHADSGPS